MFQDWVDTQRQQLSRCLFDDLGNQTSGNRPATLTNVDTLTSLDSNRVVHSGHHLHVVTRHNHLGGSVLGALREK